MNTNMNTKKLYLITNASPFDRQLKILKKVMPLGIDYLQYRQKSMPWEQALDEIHQLSMLCHLFEVPLIINDRLDVVTLTDAQGIHLGEEDLPVKYVRRLGRPNLIIGATAKTPERAALCENAGADYLGVGAFYQSSTKNNAKLISIETLKAIRSAVTIPIFGIGGLTPENTTASIWEYVDGFAVSDAVFSNADPVDVVKHFKML
ncbi:thiamine phosphate synthase [Fusibacter sp. 3D3]|uniref:thiamine phosphate synthase n=1 Tax=Fusibacter sp. 3D3 TaxID=1048380 RepID=UPI00085309E1|nr:thiamine phosphate synthase [Fusibacter sp. 3D3]GAU76208.1 Thiamin-phosphate pyrophosphorylase [Fusibacter sp. 3D3]